MRACVLAVALTALAQPALARDHRVAHHVGAHHHRVAWRHHARTHLAYLRTQAPIAGRGALDAMIARHAQANGVPEALVRRVVMRESRYNPRARNHGALGLMQIKHATARSMGYAGPASGLLDAETNLTYAVRYLAGAYRAAGGNANRAVAFYASGYRGRAPRFAPTQVALNSAMQSTQARMSDATSVRVWRHHRRHRR